MEHIGAETALDDPTLDALERLAMGSVAVTERAIAAAGTDLTFVQWRVLLIVGESGAGATVGEIAARIGAHASPASRLVSRLRRRGIVQAARDPTDRRVTRVRLTAMGGDLRRRVLEHRRRELGRVAARIVQQQAGRTLLDHLARAMEDVA